MQYRLIQERLQILEAQIQALALEGWHLVGPALPIPQAAFNQGEPVTFIATMQLDKMLPTEPKFAVGDKVICLFAKPSSIYEIQSMEWESDSSDFGDWFYVINDESMTSQIYCTDSDLSPAPTAQ